ncbi:class I SAM-dependent methyltransferase [Ferrimonas marina]|uniref:23S rRNA (Cytosine1962-C5)-methyltransferase n=1 Tax=Ferrimonas marina TaxID=299255 RepID=A0A1M5SGG5_9GAMM|nr:class I SAM-dependent methyltransferase [Ferrimonas marina]SHH37687.1 23S rRNA (cytosine1962-C5)-methyltransferase [Ferrimonas marina]
MNLLEHLPSALPEAGCGRLLHGRGYCFPGLEGITLDWFPPSLLFTHFVPLESQQRSALISQLQHWWQGVSDAPFSLVWQDRHTSPAQTDVVGQAPPQSHWVEEGGLAFEVDLARGQNHGLFLDMAEGRAWVRQHAQGRRVLNLFAYTCAFSVFAMAGGAKEVVNLDMSKPALGQGKRNHLRNGFDHGVRYLGHDLFKSFGKLNKLGPYDLVVVDPPSFQKGSFVATKDYARLLRRLPELVAPQGDVLLCLNAPELSRAFLKQQVAEVAPSLQYQQQLANPASFPDVDPDRALKVLHYRQP